MVIEYNDFISFCGTLLGRQIPTIGKRSHFTVLSVNVDRIEYKISTGNPRYTERVRIQKVLDRYEKTHSFKVKACNLTVLIHEMFELGIKPDFISTPMPVIL